MAEPSTIQRAYRPFELKSVDEEKRTFDGFSSTWDPDLGDDAFEYGAFRKSLNDWRSSGGKKIIPLIDLHNRTTVRAVFGRVEEAEETKAGLETRFSVVLSPDGDEYLARIKGGYINGLSVGYKTIRAEPVEKKVGGETKRIRLIREAKLAEVSAVIWGMNPDALVDTASIKALIHEASDRDLSEAEVAELKSLRDEIDAMIQPPPPAGLPWDDPVRVGLQERIRGLRLTALRA